VKMIKKVVSVKCDDCSEMFRRGAGGVGPNNKYTCYHCRDYGWKKGPYEKDYQQIAYAIMNFSIRAGELPHIKVDGSAGIPCVDCGKPAQGYDHRDYRKPLDVDPVCNPCNRTRGTALPYTGWGWRRK